MMTNRSLPFDRLQTIDQLEKYRLDGAKQHYQTLKIRVNDNVQLTGITPGVTYLTLDFTMYDKPSLLLHETMLIPLLTFSALSI
jgi:hypothetical protein